MAKRKTNKPKKHIFKLDELPEEFDFFLIGIQTKQALYRLVFDFNKQFNSGFQLAENLQVFRKNKTVFFENYVSEENAIGQKMRLMNNEILVPIAHPNTLFDTHEAYYLFPELSTLNYLLMIPQNGELNFVTINRNFKTNYPVNWIEVNMKKCHTAFPVFPV